MLIEKGCDGEVYNIGGSNEVKNVDLTRQVLNLLERPESLITHVPDRPVMTGAILWIRPNYEH
ncbi:MAG: hypothetical protein CM1200mP25_2400 [Acidobacteriota bacterium]|nr:MAG: hypothetical protein CM1200mP25_2400 [Acidobacteriota bacterium]